MKKSLIVMASLILGGVALTAAPKDAKPSKEMTGYGPVDVLASSAYLVNGLDVLELKSTGEVQLSKAKKGSATVSVGFVQLPAGYDEKGATTKWAWTDVNASIVGFSGKLVYIQIVDKVTSIARIYAYQLNKTADKIKILGSTSNITAPTNGMTYASASDGKSVWIVSDIIYVSKDGTETPGTFVQQFDKKLNGLYNKGDKSKLYNAKAVEDVTTDDTVVLPATVKKYSYNTTTVGATTSIEISK